MIMTLDRYSRTALRPALVSSLAATAMSLLAAGSARAQQDTAVTLRSGLIVHPSAGVAYVMAPDGGIAAVDLASGSTRWTARAGAKPLALVGNLLVAQAEPTVAGNRLEMVTLNTQAQGDVVARGATDLPPGVRVAIGETLQGTFTAEAQRSGGNVIVTWRFERVPRQGMADPEDTTIGARPGVRRATPPVTRGALRMNLASGALTRLDTTAVRPPRGPNWLLPSGQKIDAAPPTQYESADRRHILASEAVADDRTWDKYRWSVYDRSTGRRVGEHRTHVSFAPFVVRDSLLIYETTPYARRGAPEEPAKLRAFDLTSARPAWSVEVREVVYRGPFPP